MTAISIILIEFLKYFRTLRYIIFFIKYKVYIKDKKLKQIKFIYLKMVWYTLHGTFFYSKET